MNISCTMLGIKYGYITSQEWLEFCSTTDNDEIASFHKRTQIITAWLRLLPETLYRELDYVALKHDLHLDGESLIFQNVKVGVM
jgi:hypothetical protein